MNIKLSKNKKIVENILINNSPKKVILNSDIYISKEAKSKIIKNENEFLIYILHPEYLISDDYCNIETYFKNMRFIEHTFYFEKKLPLNGVKIYEYKFIKLKNKLYQISYKNTYSFYLDSTKDLIKWYEFNSKIKEFDDNHLKNELNYLKKHYIFNQIKYNDFENIDYIRNNTNQIKSKLFSIAISYVDHKINSYENIRKNMDNIINKNDNNINKKSQSQIEKEIKRENVKFKLL